MGMYDREPNFEEHFEEGDRLVLMNLQYVGTISTRYGSAEKVLITAITRDSYPKRETYSAIGQGFAAMAKRADRSDFPHVAEYVRVETGTSGNAVKRFAKVDIDPKTWIGGDDGPPVDIGALTPSGPQGATQPDDDIPF